MPVLIVVFQVLLGIPLKVDMGRWGFLSAIESFVQKYTGSRTISNDAATLFISCDLYKGRVANLRNMWPGKGGCNI